MKFENLFKKPEKPENANDEYEKQYQSEFERIENDNCWEDKYERFKALKAQLEAKKACFPLPTETMFFGLFYKKGLYDPDRLWFSSEIQNTSQACQTACREMWEAKSRAVTSNWAFCNGVEDWAEEVKNGEGDLESSIRIPI